MKKGDKSVFALFDTRYEVESAVTKLKANHFRNSDISVLMPDFKQAQDFAYEKGTKAPEAATVGMGTGMAIGGALGWLASIGSFAIPGLGALIVAGPVMALLAGAGAGGVLGAISGALVGLGIPEFEAKRYEDFVRGGGYLLAVHVDDLDWRQRAQTILEECGGRDISVVDEIRSPSNPSKSQLPIHPTIS